MSWADKVAAEVAARYGVKVDPSVVQRVPRGISGYALPVFDGRQLIYPDADRRMKEASRAYHRQRKMGGAVTPEVKARRDQVKALHAQGLPVRDITAALQAPESTVRADLAKLGLKANPIPQPPKIEKPAVAKRVRSVRLPRPSRDDRVRETRDKVRQALDAGMTFAEAVKATALSRWTVQRVAKELGRAFARPPRVIKAGRRQSLLDQRRAQVPALHAQGLSCAEMAEKLGCRARAINLDLKALGLPFPKPRRDHLCEDPALVDARRAQLRELVPMGLSVSEIALRLGVDYRKVYLELKAVGLTLPKVKRQKKRRTAEGRVLDRRARVAEMVAAGSNRREIEAALSMTPEVLAHDLRALGLSMPRVDPRTGRAPQIRRGPSPAEIRAERRERVLSLRRGGMPIGEIAEHVGIGVSTVTEYLRAAGMGGRKGGFGPRRARSQDPEVVARVRKLHGEGLSLSYIAKRMSLSRPVVLRIVGGAAA